MKSLNLRRKENLQIALQILQSEFADYTWILWFKIHHSILKGTFETASKGEFADVIAIFAVWICRLYLKRVVQDFQYILFCAQQ